MVLLQVYIMLLSPYSVFIASNVSRKPTDPADYTSTTTRLTFGPDVTFIDVPIPITNDNVYEPDSEGFLALLNLVTTGVDVEVRPDEAMVLIIDEDGEYMCDLTFS